MPICWISRVDARRDSAQLRISRECVTLTVEWVVPDNMDKIFERQAYFVGAILTCVPVETKSGRRRPTDCLEIFYVQSSRHVSVSQKPRSSCHDS